ncbi:autotransporter outer membrane beta-barrel domain-containing protein [Campylobacter novaezeelandiae]|uniref:autotransporter outer membrane beta-barrel domain-containing protein n=1 Tax=Campylobacter novaezeelandiae TaxID=2267891 RepID=UPI001037E93A|nr:autotransporter outer membrane beta-barrel domain-containing protein [Campylobacter novaezeelandiae]TBR80444.1 autotransporter outer membrane beta-barrel domain-containing protein [Campylobacter novaezeelandiae]
MVKTSFYANKVLLGLSLGAILNANALVSQTIDINYTESGSNFQDKFQYDKNTQTWTPTFGLNEDTIINIGIWDFPDYDGNDEIYQEEMKLNIELAKDKTLTFNNNNKKLLAEQKNPVNINNLNASAKKVEATDIIFHFTKPSTINADFSVVGTTEDAPVNDEETGSVISIGGGGASFANQINTGSLTINGNFNASKTLILSNVENAFKVNGTATIKNSNFGILRTNYSELEANDFVLIRAKEFNSDILDKSVNNAAGAVLFKDLNSYLSTNNEILKDKNKYKDILHTGYTIDISAPDNSFGSLVDYKFDIKNCSGDKCLVINGGANANAKNLLTQLKVDIVALDALLAELDTSAQGYELAKVDLENQKSEIQKLIDEANKNGGKIDDNKYLQTIAPNLAGNDKSAVLVLRDAATLLGAIGADLASREGVELALNIKKGTDNTGKNISNLNSASNATNTTINVSNDVAITQRIAMLNNPYGNYALKMSNLKFATLESDMRPNYINDYANSIWANAFGGANIIDGDSAALYGATIGADRQAKDNVLLGAYFTYAKSTIKDKPLEQKSDNFQLGFYSIINLSPKTELNLRAYGQISPTKQNNVLVDGAYKADYTSKFFGLSASLGHIFDFSDNTLFIKPFAGLNYYYSYTPSYTDKGLVSKNIDSMSNNSFSLEIGAEFRKYMNESSYLFITPKIEQFIINNGDDYVANLAVNNAFFTSVKANDKKKTYAQVVLGGNLNINERLSFNAGFGAKQILAGKVDNKNETYISGQIGLKYKF